MMRIPATALVALLLIAGRLGAQQSIGVVSNAVASPVLPDIVAFERAVSDRQELQFIRLSNQRVFLATLTPTTGRPGVVVTIPGAGAGKTLSAYVGQLDWRPVAEQGRSWFAYVASDDNGHLGLMLNYIDAAGELASANPIRIPFAGQVRTPRWSRDGKHLAFVSDSSILYIVSDVSSALRSGVARSVRPMRVSAASRPALFPAWSPSGDHIAYGTEVVSGGNRNGAIEVLPIIPASGEVAGVPVIVTGELSDEDEYRPSWSRDGKYIAFYADKAGTGSARQPVSIGVVELVLRTGLAYRGIVKEGSQRWLADDVIPDEMHGPAWTSITEGSQRKDAVVFVQRDATRKDPIVVSDLQRWLAQLPRDQHETALASAFEADSPRSVSSIEMSKRMRFVFTSVRGGSEIVSYRDVAAAWAQGPEPPVVVAAIAAAAVSGAAPTADGTIGLGSHRGQDVARALLFPGLGQFSAGHRSKGAILSLAGVAGAVVAITSRAGMSTPLAAGKAAVDAISRDPSTLAAQTANYNQAKSDFDTQRSMALVGGGVFAAAWLFGILDASISSAPGTDVSLRVVPDRSDGRGSSANVGFHIAVGHLRR